MTINFVDYYTYMGFPKSSDKKTYSKPDWAVDQIVRGNGIVEDICNHGVGHPNMEWLKDNPTHMGIHGCDGCCCVDFKTSKEETMGKKKNKDDVLYSITLKGLIARHVTDTLSQDIVDTIELYLRRNYSKDGEIPAIVLTEDGFQFASVGT